MTSSNVSLSRSPAAWMKVPSVQVNVSPANPINVPALIVTQADVDAMIANVRVRFSGLDESTLTPQQLKYIAERWRLLPAPGMPAAPGD